MIDHSYITPYTWGLHKLDKALGKPDKQELITIYAGPGVGKTEFTHFVARANALNGIKVLYLSIEMPAKQLAERYAMKRAGIKNRLQYQNKEYTKEQQELIDKYYDYFYNHKNIALIGEGEEYTIDDLLCNKNDKVGVLQYYYDIGYRLFIIDNLGKLTGDQDEWKVQKQVSSKLQDWKNEYNVNVMLLHHTKGKEQVMRGTDKIRDNTTRLIKLERDHDPDALGADKARLTITQEKDSIRGDFVQTECYFKSSEYIEEWEDIKKEKKQKTYGDKFDDILSDDKF